jgi:hypothetical protein
LIWGNNNPRDGRVVAVLGNQRPGGYVYHKGCSNMGH